MNEELIEVSASYSQKLQINAYEPIEVFAALKQQCPKSRAGEVWKELYAICKAQVEWGLQVKVQEKLKVETRRARKIEQKQRGTFEEEMDAGIE
jgi:hypothetical protein